MATQSVVVKRGEGKAFWMVGTLLELKVTGEHTDGKLTVGEITVPAGGLGAPPHKHSSDEVLYVLEGSGRGRDLGVLREPRQPASTGSHLLDRP